MTKKRNSIKFECLNCGEEWRVGFNRIEMSKITLCSNCGEVPKVSQKIIARFEMDEIKNRRLYEN